MGASKDDLIRSLYVHYTPLTQKYTKNTLEIQKPTLSLSPLPSHSLYKIHPSHPVLEVNVFHTPTPKLLQKISHLSLSLYKTTISPSKPLPKPLIKSKNPVLDHRPTIYIIQFGYNISQIIHNLPSTSPESSFKPQALP
jgi:hypothetical protein